jgi:RNA 2',3'-cyclic 3'-phosphodiesterase
MPNVQTHWRVFCAIDLPRDVKSRVAQHVSSLRTRLPDARASWEKPEKLHLTLKFLGDVEVARVEALSRATERAATSVEPFELTIANAGVFPTRKKPRVLWLGVEDVSGRLASLQKSLEDECAAAGFAREQRPFKPHLTLARLRVPHDARLLADAHCESAFEPQTFKVSELVVIHSELGLGGSRYTQVSSHSF